MVRPRLLQYFNILVVLGCRGSVTSACMIMTCPPCPWEPRDPQGVRPLLECHASVPNGRHGWCGSEALFLVASHVTKVFVLNFNVEITFVSLVNSKVFSLWHRRVDC